MTTFSAILVGGPEDLPLDDRVKVLDALADVVRCEHAAGYEYFNFLGERMPFDPSVVFYEWSHREVLDEFGDLRRDLRI